MTGDTPRKFLIICFLSSLAANRGSSCFCLRSLRTAAHPVFCLRSLRTAREEGKFHASRSRVDVHFDNMTGAECLLRTLVANQIEVCFMNPGTSEMHFVAALDRVPEMRGVLCLYEGVCSGAADGYVRMRGKPAATLLHLGPGLANGL